MWTDGRAGGPWDRLRPDNKAELSWCEIYGTRICCDYCSEPAVARIKADGDAARVKPCIAIVSDRTHLLGESGDMTYDNTSQTCRRSAHYSIAFPSLDHCPLPEHNGTWNTAEYLCFQTNFTVLNLYCIKGTLALFVLVSFSGYVC